MTCNCKNCECKKVRGFEVVADKFRKHEGVEIQLPQKGTKTAILL